ncbi:MAG: type II toxin-antitoxin system PemK/MazF family toxin [Lachnospira sp.]|nr:type II toxin-antitoxin system PemK/MazF family toxin [Lachnospira sp.]
MNDVEIKRGDIVFVDNPQQTPHGNVVCGNHPAVVIQNDAGNEHSNNLIVAYLTSQLKRLELPTHVVIQWYQGLKKVSVVQAEQLATISKEDVISVIDHLRMEDMVRVDKALVASLAIGEVS